MFKKQEMFKKQFSKKRYLATFFVKFLTLFLVSLFMLAGCQKKEKKALPPPKPLSVQFELEKFNFYGEKLPDELSQNQAAKEVTRLIQSFYNSLFFNPDNFKQEALSRLAAEFFSSASLQKFQQEKIAAKSLLKLRPFLRKIVSGEGKVENLGIYQSSDNGELIGVTEVNIRAVYLLSDGKKVELVHEGELVLKGEKGNIKIEEFKFKERAKTYEKPKKKD